MKKLLIITYTFLIVILFNGCSAISNPNPDYCILNNDKSYFSCSDTTTSYFDTPIYLKIYYKDSDNFDVKEIFDYFENTLAYYHKYFDKYNEYEDIPNIYTINHSTAPVEIDDILFDTIKFAIDNGNIITHNNSPLFDVALNPVLSIWHNARESDLCDFSIEPGISYCPVPRDLIDGSSFNTNPDDIILDSNNKTIGFLKENMSIDLGGMAKGYVTKIISDYLNSLNITYILNAGNSNVIGGGTNPERENGNFYIALKTPSTDYKKQTDYFLTLSVPQNIAVVTSGNYQQFFKGLDDSLVYHHIINPITYYPGGYSMSVTLLYPDSALADIFSTALYLMPLEEAMDFVNSYDNLEAVWYHYDGTYEYSDGFSQYIYDINF